jgi:hypothetical protein
VWREEGREGGRNEGREGGREGGRAYLRDVRVEAAAHQVGSLRHLPVVVPLEEGVEEGFGGVAVEGREGGREGGRKGGREDE